MGVAYFLLDTQKDTQGKRRYVGAHALAQGYKREECWHSDEINSKMIHFLNKKYGGLWKLISEDDDEAGEEDDFVDLGFRKDVRTYACKIGLTTWNELRMKDIDDHENEYIKFKRRYIKPIDKEEEEDLVRKFTAFSPVERMKLKLRQEFCRISIFNEMKALENECTDKKDFIVRLVGRINKLLAPLCMQKKNKKNKKKRKADETVIKKEKKKVKIEIDPEALAKVGDIYERKNVRKHPSWLGWICKPRQNRYGLVYDRVHDKMQPGHKVEIVQVIKKITKFGETTYTILFKSCVDNLVRRTQFCRFQYYMKRHIIGQKWDSFPHHGSIVSDHKDGSILMVVDRDSEDPSKYTLEKLYFNTIKKKWCVLLPKERFTRMWNLYVQEEFDAVDDTKEKRILKDIYCY